MKKLNFLFMFALACGDNIHPSDKVEPTYDDTWPDLGFPQKPYDAPAAVDAHVDDAAPEHVIDASVSYDAGTHAACCVGALNGNVPLECGPPMGKCTKFACDGVELLVCRGTR